MKHFNKYASNEQSFIEKYKVEQVQAHKEIWRFSPLPWNVIQDKLIL